MKIFRFFLTFLLVAGSVGVLIAQPVENDLRVTQITATGAAVNRLWNPGAPVTTWAAFVSEVQGDLGIDATITAAIEAERSAARTITNATITSATDTIEGDDTAYNATSWNGSLAPPTKNAVRDQIELFGQVVALADEDEKNVAEALKSNDRRLRSVNTAANINTINPMVGDITLSTDDGTALGKSTQVLFPNTTSRKVILPASGDFFVLFNTDTTFFNKLAVRDSGDTTTIVTVYGGLNCGLQFIDADGAGGAAGAWTAFPVQIDYKEYTVFNPSGVQATSDIIPLFSVDAFVYPNGITALQFWVKTDASSSYSVIFEEYTDPTTLDSTIETVATSTSTEASDASFANTNIAAGNIIKANLPVTAFSTCLTLAFAFIKNP